MVTGVTAFGGYWRYEAATDPLPIQETIMTATSLTPTAVLDERVRTGTIVSRLIRKFIRDRALARLLDLDDRMLLDVGLSRHDLEMMRGKW